MSREESGPTPEPIDPTSPSTTAAHTPRTPDAPDAPDALRASHEDRDAVVEQLRVAAGDGRLTAEELDDRLGTALTARTYGELAVLVRDLPAATGPSGSAALMRPGAPGSGPAPEVVRMQARHSRVQKTGPWLVPPRMEVEARSANALVDLTAAVVRQPVLDLQVSLHSSHLRLVVPAGVLVEVDDLEVRSSEVKQRAEHQPGTPVTLLVRVSGLAKSSRIEVRRPHEGFWARRLRRRKALTA
ncbi:DUF1707 SHOCT-like domain-containing protein [Streptacidiphilus cavernicola]|uniref:DUF1707 domain-containing protein n=1 Tax=Streptacidiphilus cavernicola TaxID=3342716 RepID=A0ABV6W2G0_9ACTN